MAALFLTGLDFSISAAIGFVSLFGVSVMDGILMITYYNDLRGRACRRAERCSMPRSTACGRC